MWRIYTSPSRGFSDRGLVCEGFAADLVIFDPAHVQDKATFANRINMPKGLTTFSLTGASRLRTALLWTFSQAEYFGDTHERYFPCRSYCCERNQDYG